MTIADKLLELNDVKQDIKVAIENKGADLTGVEFDGYAGKIDEIQTGGAPQGETWVINEEITITQYIITNINFSSNNELYQSITMTPAESMPPFPSYILYNSLNVVNGNNWIDEAYRTVTFETAPTGDLLTWLQANAVKTGAVVELTQAQYDALSVYDDNTYYLIVEE